MKKTLSEHEGEPSRALRPLGAFTPAVEVEQEHHGADGSINGYAAQHLWAADAAVALDRSA